MFNKKHTFKIPKNVLIIYSSFNGYFLFKDKSNKVRLIKTFFKLKFLNKNTFNVTSKPINYHHPINKKKINTRLSTQVTSFKQCLYEISNYPYKKLIFVGLGYKFLLIKKNTLRLLQLKLGYSHDIYIKVPCEINLQWYNHNSIYILSKSIIILNGFSNKIKAYRIPDTYLGKGIMYFNEKISLKKGKQA